MLLIPKEHRYSFELRRAPIRPRRARRDAAMQWFVYNLCSVDQTRSCNLPPGRTVERGIIINLLFTSPARVLLWGRSAGRTHLQLLFVGEVLRFLILGSGASSFCLRLISALFLAALPLTN